MKRPYTVDFYQKRVAQLYKKIKNLNITTDIIVGFPGETEKDFEKTLQMVKKCQFGKVHIFPFSKREGTEIFGAKDEVPKEVIRGRVERLKRVALQVQKRKYQDFFGKKFEVLVERKKDGFWTGYTENYIPVKIGSNKNLKNQIIKIKLTDKNFVLK